MVCLKKSVYYGAGLSHSEIRASIKSLHNGEKFMTEQTPGAEQHPEHDPVPGRESQDAQGSERSSGLSRRSILIGGGLVAAAAVVTGITLTAKNAAPAGGQAALIIQNGRVWTGNPKTFAEAVAVSKSGTILAVGSLAEVKKFNGPNTEVLDARGGTVMPGIHDGHIHSLQGAESAALPALANATLTVAELQGRLQGILDEQPNAGPDEWLLVADWNPTGLKDAVAHKRFLDQLNTRRPIVLRGSDFHNALANSRALELSGITSATPDPAAGSLERDADGPTGLLKDAAMGLVMENIPEASPEQNLAAYKTGFAFLTSTGVTSIMEAVSTPESTATFADLSDSGVVRQRVNTALRLNPEQIADPAGTVAEIGKVRDLYADHPMVSTRTAKVFMDGVAEYPALTAAMLEPYLDDTGAVTDRQGDLYVSGADFAKLATALDAADWQIHTHSIGDRAVRVSLDGFTAAQEQNGRAKNRHTITHIQFCDDADLPRFAEQSVIANMQLQWATPTTFTIDALEAYVGPERHKRQYPLGSLAAAGATISGGSDWPVDPFNPWNQVRTAVDRMGDYTETGGSLFPEQGVDLNTSLTMHTAGSAYQLFQEKRTGTIEVGKQADLVVLDRDLFGVPLAEVSGSQVNFTLIGGEVVHDGTGHSTASASFSRRGAAAAGTISTALFPAMASHASGRHRNCCERGQAA